MVIIRRMMMTGPALLRPTKPTSLRLQQSKKDSQNLLTWTLLFLRHLSLKAQTRLPRISARIRSICERQRIRLNISWILQSFLWMTFLPQKSQLCIRTVLLRSVTMVMWMDMKLTAGPKWTQTTPGLILNIFFVQSVINIMHIWLTLLLMHNFNNNS